MRALAESKLKLRTSVDVLQNSVYVANTKQSTSVSLQRTPVHNHRTDGTKSPEMVYV